MAKGRNRPVTGFSIEPETIARIEFVAHKEGVNRSKALDLIVSEWATDMRFEPLKTEPNSPDLSKIKSMLEGIKHVVDSNYENLDYLCDKLDN